MEKLGNMRMVTVTKVKLLRTLHKNRATHTEEFEEARGNYGEVLVEFLEKKLDEAKNSSCLDDFNVNDLPEKPRSYVKYYDEAISILEYSEDKELVLEHDDFKNYVLDDWHWKENFINANATYAAGKFKR